MDASVLGHLIIAGSTKHFADIAVELGFEPKDGLRQIAMDIAGEIGNIIIGKIEGDCEELLGDIRLGLPFCFSAERLSMHHGTSQPSVCLTLDVLGGSIMVEFCFQAIKGVEGLALDDDLLDAGAVFFL